MIPNQTLIDYPEFSNNGTKVKPDDQKYAAGFIPTDVLPAEWLNWFLNKDSAAITELNKGVASIEGELNNLLAAGSQTPAEAQTAQVVAAINKLIQTAVETEQQKTPVGVPTMWFSEKPDWALDFGNGAATQYLWANYPKLNNDKFKGILETFSNSGLCSAYDATGFFVPDLRGAMLKATGTNGRGFAHDSISSVGEAITQRLPNIIGSISNYANTNFQDVIDNANFSGAFFASYSSTGRQANSNTDDFFSYINAINFDASRSNSCYMNNANVTPFSVGFMWIVRFI